MATAESASEPRTIFTKEKHSLSLRLSHLQAVPINLWMTLALWPQACCRLANPTGPCIELLIEEALLSSHSATCGVLHATKRMDNTSLWQAHSRPQRADLLHLLS